MKHFYIIHQSKTAGQFDIQFYQDTGGQILPDEHGYFTFERKELIKLRDELDVILGNDGKLWPTDEVEALRTEIRHGRREISQARSKAEKLKISYLEEQAEIAEKEGNSSNRIN